MVIGVTYYEEEVFPHFGRSPYVAIYLVNDENVIVRKQIVEVSGPGHESITYLLLDLDVDVLLCGGIGMGAINALASVGIDVYPGCGGKVDEVVNNFLLGKIEKVEGATCNCHEHEHESCECEDSGHVCHCHDDN